LEAAREITRKTQGWLTEAEGEALFRLASQCRPPGVIVEVGSFLGKSTTWIALGTRSGSGLKVCAVDPQSRQPGTYEVFTRNVRAAGIEGTVVPYVMTSADAASKIDDDVVFAFIDGSHLYEDVKLDVKLWYPKVVKGGYMAFHDALCNGAKGVHDAVKEDVYESGRFRNVRFVGSLVICQKGGSGVRERLRTRWGLLIYDATDVVFDVSGRKRLRTYLPRPVLSGVKRVLRWLQLNTSNPED
jgi:predicted O-methyltransferase YrrM